MFEATGVDGRISFDGRFVTIEKKQFMTARGRKVIVVRAVTAIQFKEAGLTAGFIQIVFSGGGESSGGVFDAAKDENSILFTAASQNDFVQVAKAIKDAL